MKTRRLPLALLIAATTSPAIAFDAETANRVNTANSLLREGRLDEAITGYMSANATQGDTKDRLNYNLGVAQYRKGELATAKEMFALAASSTDATLASVARYNLGNCFYADGVASSENNSSAAIQTLTQAIEHYRGSLAIDPNHVNARANIELANELLKKLKNQQQEQRDKPNDNQQDSESNENDSEQEQPQKGTEGKNPQDKRDEQKSSQPEQKSGEQRRKDDDQKESSNKSGDNADQETSQKPDSTRPNEDDKDQSQDDKDQSQGDKQALSGELKPSTEGPNSPQSTVQVGADDDKAKSAPMSKDEALKMLQAIRDRDMLRRYRAEQIERNMHIPTDRDW